MGQGNQTREKKPAWDPLKDYDERAKAYQAERKVQSKYNREQGADLPKSLVEQVQNRDKIEQAKGGQYETSVRKPRQGWNTVTKDIPFEGPYSIMQTEINNLKFAAENATNDQITRSMLNHAISMENEMIAAQEMDNPTTVEVVNRTGHEDQLSGKAGAKARMEDKNEETDEYKLTSENRKEDEFDTWDTDSDKITREKIKPVSETYDRTDPTQRRDRRLEEKLVEGRPLDKFKLNVERGNTGTPVSELFHKAK